MNGEGYYDRGLVGGLNTLEARAFWNHLDSGELAVQQCGGCDEYVFPPQSICPYCWGRSLEWTETTGRGSMFTYSTVHVETREAWSDMVPYIVALIELEEGIFLLSTVVDCDPGDVEIGTEVEVVLRPLPGMEGNYPLFRPL